MTVKLLTEHYLEILALKGGYTGMSESTLVKMPHCWKSCVCDRILTILSKCMTAEVDFHLETDHLPFVDKWSFPLQLIWVMCV